MTKNEMFVRLCGVRGSFPTPPLPSKNKISFTLGGNTTCVEVRTRSTQLIIDGGTGIRNIIPDVMKSDLARGRGEIHLYMTHFHWDHLMGLPFFPPFYIPGNKIHIYSVHKETRDVFQTVFKRPYFPVPYSELGAKFFYHCLKPRVDYKLGDLTIAPFLLDHPDPCWGLRVLGPNKQKYVHAVDNEMIRTSRKDLGKDLIFYKNADLLFFDAEYSVEESLKKVNWGHSNALKGFQLAEREGIKKILFAHHDPMKSDKEIINTIKKSLNQFLNLNKEKNKEKKIHFEWDFAREEARYRLI